MKFYKNDNAYAGKLFEQEVACMINKQINDSIEYSSKLSKEQIVFIKKEAQKFYNKLKLKTKLICADWVGNKAKKENCDIIINNDIHTEIKFVSNGSGTYLNTSLYYFSDRLGLKPYTLFLEKYGVYNKLEEFFDDSVRKNRSPVTKEKSSNFRHTNKKGYAELVNIEREARKKYTEYIFNSLNENNDKLMTFLNDCISKNICDKTTPDRIIVYNYNIEDITYDISKNNLDEILSNKKTINDFGFTIGKLRFALGWQNGNGLCNPTLRVFIV